MPGKWTSTWTVVSRDFLDILRNARLSGTLTPAHGYEGKLLVLVHRINSMYREVKAERRTVAWIGDEDLSCVHFE